MKEPTGKYNTAPTPTLEDLKDDEHYAKANDISVDAWKAWKASNNYDGLIDALVAL
jgi:hypothetical protein